MRRTETKPPLVRHHDHQIPQAQFAEQVQLTHKTMLRRPKCQRPNALGHLTEEQKALVAEKLNVVYAMELYKAAEQALNELHRELKGGDARSGPAVPARIPSHRNSPAH